MSACVSTTTGLRYSDIRIDEAAALMWPQDQEDKSKMVMPGDNVEMVCEIYNPLALENGQRFNIRCVSERF